MGKMIPFDPMASDQGPVKLRIPPKECESCGGKFIPGGTRQKYCPNCSRMSPKEREMVRKMHGSPSSEVVTYIDETKKRQRAANKKEKDMKQDDLEWKHEGPVLAKVKETTETKDGLTLEAELTEAAKKLEAERETIRIQKEERKRMLAGMIRAIESEFGVRLIDASDLMPVKLEVAGKTYSGIWVRRQDWMGGDDDQD